MRKILLATFILTIVTAGLSAEHFRLGITGTAEFADRPSFCEFFESLNENTDLFPGLYWEVIPKRLGFGGTYLVRFLHADGTMERDWAVEWIASMDLRYHFLKECFFDPFVELDLGCAGRVEFTELDYRWSGPYASDTDFLALTLFAQAGVGVAVRLENFHVGGKLLYRFCVEPIPATDIAEFPLPPFQASLFAGVSF